MEPDSGGGGAAAVSSSEKALLLSTHIPHKEWTIAEEGGGANRSHVRDRVLFKLIRKQHPPAREGNCSKIAKHPDMAMVW